MIPPAIYPATLNQSSTTKLLPGPPQESYPPPSTEYPSQFTYFLRLLATGPQPKNPSPPPLFPHLSKRSQSINNYKPLYPDPNLLRLFELRILFAIGSVIIGHETQCQNVGSWNSSCYLLGIPYFQGTNSQLVVCLIDLAFTRYFSFYRSVTMVFEFVCM